MKRPVGSHSFSIKDLPGSEFERDEALREDKIQLVDKLLQLCSKDKTKIELWGSSALAEFDPDRAGFDLDETINDLLEAGVVKEIKSTPKRKSNKDGSHHRIAVYPDKLQRYAEKLHDELEIEGAKVLGIEQQKRNLLKLLTDRFNEYPEQEVFTYSEKILGPYDPRDQTKPLGEGFLQPDPNRPDIRYQFMRSMRELEKERHFSIEKVEIDFDAQPKRVGKFLSAFHWDINQTGYYPPGFYPPEHCKVILKVKRPKKAPPEKSYNQLLQEVRQKGGGLVSLADLNKRYNQLLAEIKSPKIKPKPPSPSYDQVSAKISFMNKTIPIPKNRNQDALCRVIFRDKAAVRREWSWDEMLEEWGGEVGKAGYKEEFGKEAWRVVYNAGREINKKVAIETGIKDLLIVKKLSIAVNPEYLK